MGVQFKHKLNLMLDRLLFWKQVALKDLTARVHIQLNPLLARPSIENRFSNGRANVQIILFTKSEEHREASEWSFSAEPAAPV